MHWKFHNWRASCCWRVNNVDPDPFLSRLARTVGLRVMIENCPFSVFGYDFDTNVNVLTETP
jgi:hypothetical protein